MRADIAISTAFDKFDRVAAAELADALSITHEGNAGKRPSDLRQRA